jgi:DNA primase
MKGTAVKFLKLNGIQVDDVVWKSSRGAGLKTLSESLTLDNLVPIKYSDYPKFLKSRGIEPEDVKKYRLLFGLRGKYKDKLVIPLYEGNHLVYMVARDLKPEGRYYNIQKEKLSILPYYEGVDCKKLVLCLCEGALDAISINKLGYSSAVLLGTILSDQQIKKIKEYGILDVVICLDGDAIKKALGIRVKLKNAGVDAKVVFFHKKDDPNDVFVRNPKELFDLIAQARIPTLSDFVMSAMGKK